jgi:hypothetical protein
VCYRRRDLRAERLSSHLIDDLCVGLNEIAILQVMYKGILVALDPTAAHQTILELASKLALPSDSSFVLPASRPIPAARLFGANAVSPEIQHDKAYLQSLYRCIDRASRLGNTGSYAK